QAPDILLQAVMQSACAARLPRELDLTTDAVQVERASEEGPAIGRVHDAVDAGFRVRLLVLGRKLAAPVLLCHVPALCVLPVRQPYGQTARRYRASRTDAPSAGAHT